MKRYDSLDVMKFILSFFIVAIHVELFSNILYPWLRLAVLLFCMVSSFLLFTKIQPMDVEQQGQSVRKFVKRNVTLYGVWFVILLPVKVLARRVWFENGVVIGILTCIRYLFFGKHVSSVMVYHANVPAVILVFAMTQNEQNTFLTFVVSLVLYVLCSLVSGYASIIEAAHLDTVCRILNIPIFRGAFS